MCRHVSIPALALVLLLPASLLAQDDPPAEGPPTHEGATSVTAAIGQAGAIMALRNGARLLLPPRLPIGSSRLLTFGGGRTVRPASVAAGFQRIGPTLSFDGAIDAQRSPLVVSIRQPRLSARRGHRLVLAMEQAGLCTDDNRADTLGAGLCSVWELLPATHDAGEGRLKADLPVPGGYRLQFGWVPEAQ